MAQPRFFLRSVLTPKDYLCECREIIDYYIHMRTIEKPGSRGIDRANKLKKLLDEQLVLIAGLNSEQIMWRMLEYLGRKNDKDMSPFETSTRLRGMLLDHLCKFLGISKSDIAKEDSWVLVNEITKVQQEPFPSFTCSILDDDERLEKAKRNLIKKALLQRARKNEREIVKNAYLAPLLASIVEYELFVASRCFWDEGKERAAKMRTKVQYWYAYEKLNEIQLLFRVKEHLDMQVKEKYGVLNTSKDLRLFVARGMCKHLQLDESVITQALEQSRKQSAGLFHVLGNNNFSLGPVAKLHRPVSEIDLRRDYLDKAFSEFVNAALSARPRPLLEQENELTLVGVN